MERLTGNQAKSLMEAYAQIYSQPKVEMLNEKIGIGPERERIPMSSGRLTIPGAKREAEARRQLAKNEADSKSFRQHNLVMLLLGRLEFLEVKFHLAQH